MDYSDDTMRPVGVDNSCVRDGENDEDGAAGGSAMGVVSRLFAEQNLHDVPSEILSQVPSQYRENCLEEVHGVLKPVQECSEMIEEKLRHLSVLLSDQPANSEGSKPYDFHEIYEKIKHEYPSFTERCLLSCLRADRFDTVKASARVKLLLEAKVRLFGIESVGKDLGLRDLVGLERRALDDGAIQVVRERDRSGRAIIAHFNGIGRNYPVDALLKVLLCLGSLVARDVEVQKRGFVYVVCSFEDQSPEVDRIPPILHLFSCLPIRLSACHFCTHDLSRRREANEATRVFDVPLLCRFNSHYGSCSELRQNLATFGIPINAMPFQDDGTIDLTSHTDWVAKTEQSEESDDCNALESRGVTSQESPLPRIDLPRPHDVCFGKGPKWTKHPGNQILKGLLEGRRGEFESASRFEKMVLVRVVYSIMQSKGIRFLLQIPEGTWTEVSEKQALDRIGQALRNQRRVRQKNTKVE